MKKRLRAATAAILAVITVAVLAVAISFSLREAPAPEEATINYGDLNSNSLNVVETQKDGYLVYAPEGDVEWVLLFYVGTAMPADNYDAVMNALASRGIAVIVSENPFADLLYEDTEKAFDEYPDAKYFVGGHSQGGGAAIRRTAENPDRVKGTILYSPMIVNDATLADKDVPAIYFEAENDRVLTADYKAEAASRMNEDCEFVFLEGANHMCYGSTGFAAFDGENTRPLTEIRDEVIAKTLAFAQRVINGYGE